MEFSFLWFNDSPEKGFEHILSYNAQKPISHLEHVKENVELDNRLRSDYVVDH